MYCSWPGSSVHGYSPGKNTGVGCHAFFQGIFSTQKLNSDLLCLLLLSSLPCWVLYHPEFFTTSATWEALSLESAAKIRGEKSNVFIESSSKCVTLVQIDLGNNWGHSYFGVELSRKGERRDTELICGKKHQEMEKDLNWVLNGSVVHIVSTKLPPSDLDSTGQPQARRVGRICASCSLELQA